MRTFTAQAAKIESCCCLKVVRKQVKSAKPTGVKKEKGLGQLVDKRLKTRVQTKDPKSGDGVEKQARTLLSIAKKRKVETAAVHEEPGVVRMTAKERASIKLAEHTLTASACERIRRIRQWQFVKAEKRRVIEQAAKQGDMVREGRSDHCMEVLRSAGYTKRLPDTLGNLSKALSETMLGPNMVVHLVDHPMNHPCRESKKDQQDTHQISKRVPTPSS